MLFPGRWYLALPQNVRTIWYARANQEGNTLSPNVATKIVLLHSSQPCQRWRAQAAWGCSRQLASEGHHTGTCIVCAVQHGSRRKENLM